MIPMPGNDTTFADVVSFRTRPLINSAGLVSPTQVVILAGGKGIRLMEETTKIPKPMLQVGDKTLLEHIIGIYSSQGLHEFLIPTGYLSRQVEDYFLNKFERVYVNESGYAVGKLGRDTVSIIYTGEDTQTGGRIKRLQPYITGSFHLTYGDGISSVNLYQLRELHNSLNPDVTLTAVHPIPRFGALKLNGNRVTEFGEKTDHLGGWINGGYMVVSPSIFSLIDSDDTNLESDVLPYIASYGGLVAHRHEGFWKCVDTQRDLVELRQIYDENGGTWPNHSL